MTLNGAMALLHYFTEFTYNVVLKQFRPTSISKSTFDLIVYDHINYDLHDYSASICAKQQEAVVSTSDCSCLRPCLLMSFLWQWARPKSSIYGAKRVGRVSPF